MLATKRILDVMRRIAWSKLIVVCSALSHEETSVEWENCSNRNKNGVIGFCNRFKDS
jgi:hypothetical protein